MVSLNMDDDEGGSRALMIMCKSILTKITDTRHSSAFPAHSFDAKYNTIDTLLQALRVHSLDVPDIEPTLGHYAGGAPLRAPWDGPLQEQDGKVLCRACWQNRKETRYFAPKDIKTHLEDNHFKRGDVEP